MNDYISFAFACFDSCVQVVTERHCEIGSWENEKACDNYEMSIEGSRGYGNLRNMTTNII